MKLINRLRDLLNVQEASGAKTLDLAEHRYPSFRELLPYRYYDTESQLFINACNAGLLYRITPLTGANEQIAEQLDHLLRTKISNEFTFHLILVKHNQVGPMIDAFANQFSHTEFDNLQRVGTHLKDFYTNAAKTGFYTNNSVKPRLTHTQCYLVIDKALKREKDVELRALFGSFKVSFEASLTGLNLNFSACNAEDFLQLLHFYLSQDADTLYPKPVHYKPDTLLKYQVNPNDFDCEVNKDFLRLSGVSEAGKPYITDVSVLTIEKLPTEFRLWETSNNGSNIFSPEQSIPCNHMISVTYVVDEQSKAQARASRKTRDLDKKAKSDYALNVAGTEEQARAWRTFRDELAQHKTRSVNMLYNLILFSRPHERERDLESAITTFAYNRIKLSRCNRLQLPYFLASMPFLFTNHLAKDFSLPTMMWQISSWNACQYMPLLADWTGVGTGLLMPTMREQFALIDPFSDRLGTSYNIAITGMTGSGKSFATQLLMLNVLFNGGDVFIIDIGGSYRKLCQLLGGTYLEYEHLTINPFTHVVNLHQELDEIVALFELLACPRSKASDDDLGTLREGILQAFSRQGTATLIDDVQKALLELYENNKDTYPTAGLLAKNLQRYCVDSEHGRAFNAPSQLNPLARVIVVDLKQIEDNAAIRSPVLLSVISQFQRRMFHSDRNKQKMCIIDEAWKFFTGDAIAAEFINKGFRTGRRHKASFVTITQGIADYYKFEEARAAWENSSLKLIFLQDKASLTEHQKTHKTFDDYEFNVLTKFPNAKETGYSQVLVKANDISSFHRLFVDPFTTVMLSSDGHDYQAVLDYEKTMPFLEAVERVAKERYGVRYA